MVNNNNNNNSPDYTPLYEQQQQNSERDVIDNNNNPTAKKRNYGTYLDEHHHSYSQQQRHHSQHSQHYQQPYDHHSHHSQQNPPPSIGGYSSDDERSSTNYSHHHHYPSLSSSSTSSTNPTSHLPTSSSVNASGSVSGSVGNNYLNNSNIIMGFNKKKLRLSIHENTKNAIQQQLFHGSTSVLLTITKQQQQDNLHSSDQQQQVIIDKNNTSGNVGGIIPPSIQFLQSIMPYKDCVLKYIYLNNNNLLIEFIDLHSTLIFIYLYYDIGIIYNDNKYLLNLILNNNDNSLINIVYPNYNNNNSINNKILYLIIKDLTFLDKLFNYYLLNLNFKLLELPNIDKSKRILIEFNNINDYNNIYEQLNNLNNIIIIKSKLNNLNLENYNYPTIEYKNNNNNSTILYVDGFTSKKVNCNVLFLLFGIYGDVIKIKISFLGNIPYALIQFTNIEGANRSFNFLNNNYSLFGEAFNISFTNLIDINETFPNLDIYSSTPPSTNTLLNIENTNYSNYHLLIGELFETYYDHPLHRFRLGSAIGSLKNLDHITEPNKMLCISNIQIDTTSEELESYFLGIANIKMEQVKFFGHKPKLRTKMATVTLPSINDAITALVLLNDIKVNDHHININFAEPIRNITIHPAYPTVQSNNNYTTTSTTYYGSATNNNFVPPPPYNNNNNSGGSGSGHFRGSSSRGRGSGGYRGRGGGYYRGGGRGNVMQ